MDVKTFLKRLEQEYNKCVEISRAKNKDYAGDKDPFKNFKLVEFLTNGSVTAEMGIIVRMSDKLQRITNLLTTEAQVKDESIGDTLSDLANYSMILKLLIESRNDKMES